MSKQIIAMKNDNFRESLAGGRVVLTPGVFTSKDKNKVLDAVRVFNSFTPDNDPYGERDFGKVVVDGEGYFFKIDYYDKDYQYFEEDGNRVMTIMRTEEY